MKARTLIAAGIAILAAVRYVGFRPRKPRDEDRPAMIVKGGSLIFQSGDETMNEKGVPWKEVRAGQWTPEQLKGKAARRMLLTVRGEDDCDFRRIPVTRVVIRYFGTAELEGFQIVSARHKGIEIPLVIGERLSPGGGSKDYPTIERPGSGTTFTLSYTGPSGTRDCQTRRARIDFAE